MCFNLSILWKFVLNGRFVLSNTLFIRFVQLNVVVFDFFLLVFRRKISFLKEMLTMTNRVKLKLFRFSLNLHLFVIYSGFIVFCSNDAVDYAMRNVRFSCVIYCIIFFLQFFCLQSSCLSQFVLVICVHKGVKSDSSNVLQKNVFRNDFSFLLTCYGRV